MVFEQIGLVLEGGGGAGCWEGKCGKDSSELIKGLELLEGVDNESFPSWLQED